jgi:hypothetical protein
MNDQQRSRSQVTVEDLLRVKRAERPSPEFWADFEKNLRAKQLAAIVQPRRQWSGWSWKSLARWTVPVGAAAVLGVTFVNFNSGRSFSAKSPAALPGHELASASTVSSPEPVIVAPSAGVAVSEPAKTLQVAAMSPTQNVPAQDAVVAAPVQASTVTVAARNVELASVTEQIAGVAAAAQPVAVDAFPAGKSGTVSAAAERSPSSIKTFGPFANRLSRRSRLRNCRVLATHVARACWRSPPRWIQILRNTAVLRMSFVHASGSRVTSVMRRFMTRFTGLAFTATVYPFSSDAETIQS